MGGSIATSELIVWVEDCPFSTEVLGKPKISAVASMATSKFWCKIAPTLDWGSFGKGVFWVVVDGWVVGGLPVVDDGGVTVSAALARVLRALGSVDDEVP